MQFNSNPQVGGGSKNYLKLEDGQSTTGVFAGNPQEFYVLWEDGKATECDKDIKGASFRFRINFITNENGTYVAKIFEQGATVYNLLKELNEEFPLDKTVVVIRRNGIKMNTSYSIIPSGRTKWTPELGKKLEQVALHALGEEQNGMSQADPD